MPVCRILFACPVLLSGPSPEWPKLDTGTFFSFDVVTLDFPEIVAVASPSDPSHFRLIVAGVELPLTAYNVFLGDYSLVYVLSLDFVPVPGDPIRVIYDGLNPGFTYASGGPVEAFDVSGVV